jgi:NADH-quinone oxidoreductase subunit N
LVLGQAGVPFTTGFLAKFEVVGAAVDTHAYGLAVVAMVSAAVAAFFYLRVAITMFSPVGEIADATDGGSLGGGDPGRPGPAGAVGTGVPSSDEQVSSLQVLTDAPPAESVAVRGVVPVPFLTAVAITVSVAFTVVFGIIPGPILDFADHATLLFS